MMAALQWFYPTPALLVLVAIYSVWCVFWAGVTARALRRIAIVAATMLAVHVIVQATHRLLEPMIPSEDVRDGLFVGPVAMILFILACYTMDAERKTKKLASLYLVAAGLLIQALFLRDLLLQPFVADPRFQRFLSWLIAGVAIGGCGVIVWRLAIHIVQDQAALGQTVRRWFRVGQLGLRYGFQSIVVYWRQISIALVAGLILGILGNLVWKQSYVYPAVVVVYGLLAYRHRFRGKGAWGALAAAVTSCLAWWSLEDVIGSGPRVLLLLAILCWTFAFFFVPTSDEPSAVRRADQPPS